MAYGGTHCTDQISIHALRKESDKKCDNVCSTPKISIHALRKESDVRCEAGYVRCISFQSTLSVRRATHPSRITSHAPEISIHALRKESDPAVTAQLRVSRISIHALRKESDHCKRCNTGRNDISIHALRKESDAFRVCGMFVWYLFQSTLSVRRATTVAPFSTICDTISIHALRKESDQMAKTPHASNKHFNPRSP